MAASREEVYERVKEVLTEQLGVEESEITEEASFQEDLDADSLDHIPGLAHSSSIDQKEWQTKMTDRDLDNIACGPGNFGDNSPVAFAQSIDKA